MTSTQRFLPYGAPRSGSIGATDRGWIGQTKDASTGLQYLNARYYDPTIGRFTATDPIIDTERPGSLDRSGYGYARPVTLTGSDGPVDPLWQRWRHDVGPGTHIVQVTARRADRLALLDNDAS